MMKSSASSTPLDTTPSTEVEKKRVAELVVSKDGKSQQLETFSLGYNLWLRHLTWIICIRVNLWAEYLSSRVINRDLGALYSRLHIDSHNCPFEML